MKPIRILLALVIFFTTSSSWLNARELNHPPSAQKGVLDLRNQQFESPLVLEGEWSFAWKKLFTPATPNAFVSYMVFPNLWNNQTVEGVPLSSTGYATYGLQILLAQGHVNLALCMPQMYSSYKLFVNGQVAVANGVPAVSKELYKPHWEPHTIELPTGSDTIQLLLQVANFSHAKGGVSQQILIGNSKQLFMDSTRTIASDFLLTGCLFMGGLFFLGLYLFGTRDKATLYFSLFCMLYSYRLVGSSNYTLHAIYPYTNWELTVRMEYFSLFGSIFVFIEYLRNLYPDDCHKPVIKTLSVICGVLSWVPFITPSIVFTQVINPFLILMFFVIGYVLFVFIKAYYNNRIAAGYAMTSIAVLMIVQLIINLEYFGVLVPSKLVLFIGYVLFFFLQSLILSFRFAYTLQKAKQDAEQGLKSKSEFLSTMSHEIRTPLNSVIGMTNLMLQNNPRPDQKEQLDVLKFSSNNLLCVVNDILDFNKIEAGKISFEKIDMDLAQILYNIVSGAAYEAKEKGIGLKLEHLPAMDRMVKGDTTRLAQVINNLVGNAVKFTESGGVTVSFEVISTTEELVTILFKVKDTGIGIPKDKQRLIFERFTQADSSTSRSFGGTGLGLAISQRLLQMQGSELLLESKEGEGSLFYFTQTFALSKTRLLEKINGNTAPSKTEKMLTGKRILLVEDNQINVLVAKTFLENWGAKIDVAENGQEALDKLDINLHDLVLMDMHMPVMDGFTATNIIRRRGIRVPIIALTASLPGEIEPVIRDLDINDFVLKPFVPDDLLSKVTHHIKISQAAELTA